MPGGCCSSGKRKNGAGAAPSAQATALTPFSISSFCCCSVIVFLLRLVCDQVWVPTVWPAAATCFSTSG